MFAHSHLKAAKATVAKHALPTCVATGLKPTTRLNPFRCLPTVAHMSTSSPRRNATPTNLSPPSPTSTNIPTMPSSQKQFADYDMTGKVYVVTGGAQGLGLSLAESLANAGAKVYCLDRNPSPAEGWHEASNRVVPEWGGSLEYRQQDVTDTDHLHQIFKEIADENQRLDGVLAAAGIQQLCPAMDYTFDDAQKMMAVNYTGILQTASAAARQMFKYKCRGSICLVASMSGTIANKGLVSPVYNCSKAAVIQLARSLAMEWSPIRDDGTGGIRINCLSPGHIITPMVRKNFDEVPGLEEKWCQENMMGRLAQPEEFRGAALFLLSNASSFMTGGNLVVDGGHTAW